MNYCSFVTLFQELHLCQIRWFKCGDRKTISFLSGQSKIWPTPKSFHQTGLHLMSLNFCNEAAKVSAACLCNEYFRWCKIFRNSMTIHFGVHSIDNKTTGETNCLSRNSYFRKGRILELHPAGRVLNYDWSVNSFLMVACKNIFSRASDRKF